MNKQRVMTWDMPTDGEHTGNVYPLRAETLVDIALTVPLERIPECMLEIMAAAAQMGAMVATLRETGASEDEIAETVNSLKVLPWHDDGRGEVGLNISSPGGDK